MGGDITEVLAAGLPNITGRFNNNGNSRGGGAADGAFYIISQAGVFSNSSGASDGGTYGFDASRSNSIYGSSTTVQPPALQLIPQIKF